MQEVIPLECLEKKGEETGSEDEIAVCRQLSTHTVGADAHIGPQIPGLCIGPMWASAPTDLSDKLKFAVEWAKK